MAQTWWMTAAQLRRYQELSAKLFDLQKEHRSLMAKVIKKSISATEASRLREVIKTFNQLQAVRKRLEDENPLKPENVLAALEKAKK